MMGGIIMKAITKLLTTVSCIAAVLSASISNYAMCASAEDSTHWLYSSLADLGLSEDIITKALENQIDLSQNQNRSNSCLYYSVMSNGASFSYASSFLLYNMVSASYYGFTSGEAATSNSITVSTTGPLVNNMTYMAITQTYSASNVVTPYGSLCNFKFKGSSSSFMASSTQSGISFEVIWPGDVNCDGTLDSSDLTLLLQYISNLNPSISNEGKVAADCNGDGAINNVDATLLARVIAEDPNVVFW
jgi:hypothetical protein